MTTATEYDTSGDDKVTRKSLARSPDPRRREQVALGNLAPALQAVFNTNVNRHSNAPSIGFSA
jgi:hypothetical protein